MSGEPKHRRLKAHRMPDKSLLYDRILPAVFVVLAAIMLLLIVFAIGVLVGLVHWT